MLKPDLPIPEFPGYLIAWCKRAGEVEASSLSTPWYQVKAGESPGKRVWSDACDVGFWVRSHRSGKRVLFTARDRHENAAGETLAWEFESFGISPPVKLTVYND